MSKSRNWLRTNALELAMIAVGLGLLWTGSFHIRSDGSIRYGQLDQLLVHGKLATGKYSLIGTLFATPLWFIGSVFGNSGMRWAARTNLLHLTAGLLVLVFRPSLGPSKARLRFVLLMLLASMFPAHVSEFYGEVFTAVWAAVGLALLVEGQVLLGGFIAAVAVASTPACIIGLVVVALDRLWFERRARWLYPVILAAALVMLENLIRRGSLFAAGYDDDHGFATILPYSDQPNFSYPILLGLLGLLFSFGKGLLFFAPGLVCAPAAPSEESPSVLRVWVLFTIGLLLVYAKWWSWYGGWFWGPRFLLFASIPASLLLAHAQLRFSERSLAMRSVIVAATVLSFWVGANGYFFTQYGLMFLTGLNYSLESLVWYSPEYSVLWHPLMPDPNWAALAQHPIFGPFVQYGMMEQIPPPSPVKAFAWAAVALAVAAPLAWSTIKRVRRHLTPAEKSPLRW